MQRDVEVSTRVRAPLERARDIIRADPGLLFAEHCTSEERRRRRFHTTLAVDFGPSGGVHRSVEVEPGRPASHDARLELPLRFRATSRERFFPTFDGLLELHDAGTHRRLVLRGIYDVPLGPVGRIGDQLAGRRFAHRSLAAFIEQVAGRLDGEADQRDAARPYRPAPYHVDLRDRPHPAGR